MKSTIKLKEQIKNLKAQLKDAEYENKWLKIGKNVSEQRHMAIQSNNTCFRRKIKEFESLLKSKEYTHDQLIDAFKSFNLSYREFVFNLHLITMG